MAGPPARNGRKEAVRRWTKIDPERALGRTKNDRERRRDDVEIGRAMATVACLAGTSVEGWIKNKRKQRSGGTGTVEVYKVAT